LLSYFDEPLCRGHVREAARAYERANRWPKPGSVLTDELRDAVRRAIQEGSGYETK
jgi:hypothetical protein